MIKEGNMPDALARLADWAPPPPLVVEAPKLEDLLGGFSCQPWLVEEYASMAKIKSPSFSARAVGLVARLAMPDTREEVKSSLAKMVESGNRLWVDAARVWARGLSQEVLEEIRIQLLIDAGDLAESLSGLTAEKQELALRVEMAAIRRDDCESMCWVLDAVGQPDSDDRSEYLKAVDQEAIERLTAVGWKVSSEIPEVDEDEDEVDEDEDTLMKIVSVNWNPRLGEVAWQEPLCWWGQLAVQPLPPGVQAPR
jgi:hypothetical protein